MLLYLANTTHPDILFLVNQCAQFSNNPKESHATALKCIGCYLNTTADRGILIHQCEGIPTLDCWVDADFAGFYSKEDSKDPTSIRSQTGLLSLLAETLLCGIPSYRQK